MGLPGNPEQTTRQTAINFRRAILNDREEIFHFLSIAYPKTARYKYPERWVWEFENNPFRDPDKIPLWIATDESGKIIGQIGCMIEPVKVGVERHSRLHWGVDLVVLPEYRNQGVGCKLNQAMVEEIDNVIALPMSNAYRHYLLDLGAQEVDTTVAFLKRIRFESEDVRRMLASRIEKFGYLDWLTKLVGNLKLDKLVVRIINRVINCRKTDLDKMISKEISILEVAEFGSSWDTCWNEVADEFEVIVERRSQFLNWKYVLQPWLEYRKYVAERAGKLCGYIIVRRSQSPEANFGVIADIFASPKDEECIYSLLASGVSWLNQQGVNVIYAASSHPIFQKCFIRLKFSKHKDVHPLFKSLKNITELKQDFERLHWFFGRSDHDWDQFPYGRIERGND